MKKSDPWIYVDFVTFWRPLKGYSATMERTPERVGRPFKERAQDHECTCLLSLVILFLHLTLSSDTLCLSPLHSAHLFTPNPRILSPNGEMAEGSAQRGYGIPSSNAANSMRIQHLFFPLLYIGIPFLSVSLSHALSLCFAHHFTPNIMIIQHLFCPLLSPSLGILLLALTHKHTLFCTPVQAQPKDPQPQRRNLRGKGTKRIRQPFKHGPQYQLQFLMCGWIDEDTKRRVKMRKGMDQKEKIKEILEVEMLLPASAATWSVNHATQVLFFFFFLLLLLHSDWHHYQSPHISKWRSTSTSRWNKRILKKNQVWPLDVSTLIRGFRISRFVRQAHRSKMRKW